MKKIALMFVSLCIFDIDDVICCNRNIFSSQKRSSSGRRAPISFANVRKVKSEETKETSTVAPEINSNEAVEPDRELVRSSVTDFPREGLNGEIDLGDGLLQDFDEMKPTSIKRKSRDELAGFPVVRIPSGEGKSELSCFKSFMKPPVYKQKSFSFVGSIRKTFEIPKLESQATDDFEMISSINRSETSPNVIIMKNTPQVLERKPISQNDLLLNTASIKQHLGEEFLKSYRISVQISKNEVELHCLLLMKKIKDIRIDVKFSADLSETELGLQRGKFYRCRGISKEPVVEFLETIDYKMKKGDKFDCKICVGDYSFVIQALVLGYEFTLSKD